MAHSFIEFRDKNILMHDTDIFLVVSLIRKVLGTPHAQVTKGAADLLRHWKVTYDTFYCPGAISLDFDKFIDTKDDIICIMHALLQSMDIIGQFGRTIPGNYLTSLIGVKDVRIYDLTTEQALAPVQRLYRFFAQFNDTENAIR